MNKRITLFTFLIVLLSACKQQNDFDKDGNLLLEKLTSKSGEFKFNPMFRSDSNSVKKYVPDTFLYNNQPYSGKVVKYNAQEKRTMLGTMKDGLLDGCWTFYFATGGKQMEGDYKSGWDVGLWTSYYGYDKKKVQKYYDDFGYMIARIDYFDNGKMQYFQNIKHPLFGDKERNISFDRQEEPINIYVEDSILILKNGDKTEIIGKNIFGKFKSN